MSKKRSTLPRQFRRGALAKADQRRRDIRAYAARLHQLHADQGGTSEMPATLLSVAERYTFLEARVQQAEVAALDGGPLDLHAYIASVQTLMRLADRLGYQRRAKPVKRLHELLSEPQEPAP